MSCRCAYNDQGSQHVCMATRLQRVGKLCNYSLLLCRFPRHIRVREDKSVEEATSPDVIVDLYNKQTRKMTSAKERLEAQKKRDNAEDAKEDDTEMKSEEEVDEKAKI